MPNDNNQIPTGLYWHGKRTEVERISLPFQTVKAPLIVHQTDKADPKKYTRASVAYAEWINIAISRWKEHTEAYGKVGKKPVLFIMAENTKDADDIYAYLQGLNEFKGKYRCVYILIKQVRYQKKI